MTFEQFSNEIIASNDIDPDYVFLIRYRQRYGDAATFEAIKRKLLIYNLHSELLYGDGKIDDTQIKFGHERQKSKPHFKNWESQLSKIDFTQLLKFNGVDYLIFRENFKRLKGMGDWACWKAADLLDKVFGVRMRFGDLTFLHAYEYPLKGLLMINGRTEDTKLYRDKQLFLSDLYAAKRIASKLIKTELWDAENILELETLLCKYHSYVHKHYKPHDDLTRLRKILDDERLTQYHDLIP